MASVSRLVSKDCSLDRNQPDLSGEDSYEGPTDSSLGIITERPGDQLPGLEVDISLLHERPSKPLVRLGFTSCAPCKVQPYGCGVGVGVGFLSFKAFHISWLPKLCSVQGWIRDHYACRADGLTIRVGEHLLPNGDLYSGSLLGNMPESSGKYIWSMVCIYEGEWRRGMRHGHGKTLDGLTGVYDLMLSLQLGIRAGGMGLVLNPKFFWSSVDIIRVHGCLIVARVKAGRLGSRPKPESAGIFPRLNDLLVGTPSMADQPDTSDSATGDVQRILDGMSQMITSHDQQLQEILRLLRAQTTTSPSMSKAPVTQIGSAPTVHDPTCSTSGAGRTCSGRGDTCSGRDSTSYT
ncbi:hypothetical protein Syun_016753 [Stephania yunnanensis]|uniref:Uncharacterized protein n=1 Tax=Stephania yunnanensis TaxID=152371 RepID=A0AAP0J5I0_9MAGN